MDTATLLVVVAIVALLVVVGFVATGTRRRRSGPPSPAPGVDYAPGVGDDATTPTDTPTRTVETVDLPEAPIDTATI